MANKEVLKEKLESFLKRFRERILEAKTEEERNGLIEGAFLAFDSLFRDAFLDLGEFGMTVLQREDFILDSISFLSGLADAGLEKKIRSVEESNTKSRVASYIQAVKIEKFLGLELNISQQLRSRNLINSLFI